MKTYIVNQIIVEKTEYNQYNRRNDISVDCIIRRVDATSKEEAIGKFVLSTEGIKAEKKLLINCVELEDLTSID